MKKILQRMACGIKVLNTLSKSLPKKLKILLLIATVISHLQYSALILTGLQKSLLTSLEKKMKGKKQFLMGENKIGPEI